jgi:hypothetical protein
LSCPPQRCDSLAATQALIQQQLQDRLEASRKENQRWRASLEDTLKANSSDVAAIKLAHARAAGAPPTEQHLPESYQRELRRMLDDRDDATRSHLDQLGRAIQTLAESCHVPSPLVTGRA